ncbi:hypothetical protein AVEN_203749-1 [Araneus ventricosus]|uniref:Uncharacterized protein n=1 Tax=Araneus ventricosus TaxID=182803 RepID=A0A4Y2GC73_ARAVE|nr:hypothetical protein AVEN_203749-1 [Araneus ventricosus]
MKILYSYHLNCLRRDFHRKDSLTCTALHDLTGFHRNICKLSTFDALGTKHWTPVNYSISIKKDSKFQSVMLRSLERSGLLFFPRHYVRRSEMYIDQIEVSCHPLNALVAFNIKYPDIQIHHAYPAVRG